MTTSAVKKKWVHCCTVSVSWLGRTWKKSKADTCAAVAVRGAKLACAYVEPWFVQLHACIWYRYRAGRRVYLRRKQKSKKRGDDDWCDAGRDGEANDGAVERRQ
ncbi:hypothetical protein COCMIDRAFT_92350 [Bipolaris oryzae ATCC 44560]|uniref:Uncharacterized protein n=1 Tax=Bipolaris oryzae ATCC 44560 TaxID=930090 RepID=W6Z9E4_COCMI|nr:uncharacterized protein COCMIDRAFT_92350 [Bipolaris oryzae ATCC 44560]EUC46645.1 hypothetical protein COCMIDRAFT_92350 [Bipolaris oryzae ATCC 44560]